MRRQKRKERIGKGTSKDWEREREMREERMREKKE